MDDSQPQVDSHVALLEVLAARPQTRTVVAGMGESVDITCSNVAIRERAGMAEQLEDSDSSYCRPSQSLSASTRSSQSDDTDTTCFSEDYTRMTEVGDGSDLEQPTPMNSLSDIELDSTYNSDQSSICTVENGVDEEEGGEGTDEKTGSQDGSPPPSDIDVRPNIKLILGRTPDDDDDEQLSSPESPQSPPEIMAGAEASGSNSAADGNFFEDREFDFLKAEPVKRSTSLKTYKTPPGTPSRKKAVRFADALGLDLESVRHILNLEDPPVVPLSAMKDLHIGGDEDRKTDGVRYLSACFSQPGADPCFLERVKKGTAALENCVVNKDMTIGGIVRVSNISYHKKVVIRYSTNNWLTFDDVCATYVQNSNDGKTDRFTFTITVPQYFMVGNRLEFAVMFMASGTTYWDNNYGSNYAVECYARQMPSSESDNTWMHFL